MGIHTFTQGPGRFLKLAAALFGAVASAVIAMGLTGGSITTAEWLNIAIAAVGAFQVWYITETSDNPHGKAVIAAVAAGLIALQSFVTGSMHVNLTEWMQVGLAALTATGIWAAPSLAAPKPLGLRVHQLMDKLYGPPPVSGDVLDSTGKEVAVRPKDLP